MTMTLTMTLITQQWQKYTFMTHLLPWQKWHSDDKEDNHTIMTKWQSTYKEWHSDDNDSNQQIWQNDTQQNKKLYDKLWP